MKNLFTQADYAEIVGRINKLKPTSQPQWGKMNVAQMFTHTHRGLQSATGELKLKRSLMGIVFGRIAKKKIISDAPWGHNLPTDKNFIVQDLRDFNVEKNALLVSMQRFHEGGPQGVNKDPHPFFGMLTPEEWSRLMWKHLDHHLNQFGV